MPTNKAFYLNLLLIGGIWNKYSYHTSRIQTWFPIRNNTKLKYVLGEMFIKSLLTICINIEKPSRRSIYIVEF